MTYGVWCTVSGGVTGTRSAWLKENGVVQEFSTLEAANVEAQKMQRSMNNPNAVASFTYVGRAM